LTRRVSFLPAARAEMIAAQDWHERQSPGLGARFREELEAQVERMAEAPQRFPFMFKDVRLHGCGRDGAGRLGIVS